MINKRALLKTVLILLTIIIFSVTMVLVTEEVKIIIGYTLLGVFLLISSGFLIYSLFDDIDTIERKDVKDWIDKCIDKIENLVPLVRIKK